MIPTLKTPFEAAPVMLKIVMLRATACAAAGMPQGAPTNGTVREVFCSRTVEERESYCRQGAIPTNGSGVAVTSAVREPRTAPGVTSGGSTAAGIQNGGAVQVCGPSERASQVAAASESAGSRATTMTRTTPFAEDFMEDRLRS